MLNYIVGGTEISWMVFLAVGESHCVSHPGQSHCVSHPGQCHMVCPATGQSHTACSILDRVTLHVLLWTEILRQRSLYVLKAACESC